MGDGRTGRFVWRDNHKPADHAEWEAIVAAAMRHCPRQFGIGFYQTSAGWSFTTGWLEVAGEAAENEARGALDVHAVRRSIAAALRAAGKPLAPEDRDRPGHTPEAEPPPPGDPPRPPPWEGAEREDRLSDALIATLARLADTEPNAALIRALALEVLTLRDEIERTYAALRR